MKDGPVGSRLEGPRFCYLRFYNISLTVTCFHLICVNLACQPHDFTYCSTFKKTPPKREPQQFIRNNSPQTPFSNLIKSATIKQHLLFIAPEARL